jgi:hypothetical protein
MLLVVYACGQRPQPVSLVFPAPAAKLHVNGEIKVGNSGVSCIATTEGAQRYNSGTKKMQFCDGTGWRNHTSTCVNIGYGKLTSAEITAAGLSASLRYMISASQQAYNDNVLFRCRDLGYQYGFATSWFTNAEWCAYNNARTVTWSKGSSGWASTLMDLMDASIIPLKSSDAATKVATDF